MPGTLARDGRNFLGRAIDGLVLGGWRFTAIPGSERLKHNGQLLHLHSDGVDRRFRLFVYKAGHTGRSRPDERRIEITSTYPKGLSRAAGFTDVVLGYDIDKKVFIGFDRRRLEAGGKTGNATSFFAVDGPDLARGGADIVVLPHRSTLLGTEFHAFFEPFRIAEYLFNCGDIHNGLYANSGAFASTSRRTGRPTWRPAPAGEGSEVVELERSFVGPSARPAKSTGVSRAEEGKRPRRGTTPEKLDAILAVRRRNGLVGERFVLASERERLRRAKRPKLATNVRWVAAEDTSLGYDIRSFEPNGQELYIEVKSTGGSGRAFEMTANEWRVAAEKGNRYVIARVTQVNLQPKIEWIRDPAAELAAQTINRSPTVWRVTYS